MNGEIPVDYRAFVPDTGTDIGVPLVVEDPEGFAWDDRCDMLVVGFGLAGAAAALQGAELGGMDVLLADRFMGGGTSALSGGVIYAGGGTRVQRELGIEDSPEGMADYLMHEVGTLRRPETMRRFAEASPGTIDWLEARGVQFAGPLAKKKTSYPPADAFLYYSGSEKAPAFAGSHPPAPRGHRAKSSDRRDDKSYSGAIIMNALKRTIAADPAIRTRFQASARRLIVDPSGRVIGAELWQIPEGGKASEKHQRLYDRSKTVMYSILGLTKPLWRKLASIERREARPVRVLARRGVVLSTGGFSHNRAMVDHAAPAYAGARGAGSPGDDGSAVRLGQSVGARLSQMHMISCWRFISPPMSWTKGAVVGAHGRRIVNEELYGARLGDAIFTRSGGKAWLVTDSKVQAAALDELNNDPLWAFQRLPGKLSAWRAKKGATVAELERKLGVPTDSLVATIEGYNRAIAGGAEDEYRKSDDARVPLDTGPFYAMDISPDAAMNPIGGITMGGLDIDEDNGAVVAQSGDPIRGLYAAGRAAAGLCSESYVSGLSLGDCVWSGRLAARSIAGNRPPTG